MRSIGAYEAKTNLARLLDEVARGETIVITKHGVPVAKLVPPGRERQDIGETIDELRTLRRRIEPLGDLTLRELIEDGRRL